MVILFSFSAKYFSLSSDTTSSLRSMTNSVPWPKTLCTVIVPPISFVSFWIMVRPIPQPSTPLFVESCSRSKSSNTCFWNSSLIPIPVSLTQIRHGSVSFTISPFCQIPNVTMPPGNVNFFALLSRFIQICVSFPLSASTFFSCTSQETTKFNPAFCISNS